MCPVWTHAQVAITGINVIVGTSIHFWAQPTVGQSWEVGARVLSRRQLPEGGLSDIRVLTVLAPV